MRKYITILYNLKAKTYSYKINAMLDANTSIILLLQALLSSWCSVKESCIKGCRSLATPSKANNFRIVPECVK